MKPEKTWNDAMDSLCQIMLNEWSKEEIIEFVKERMNNEWIPCKDRLPESYGKYIVTRDDPVFGIYVRMLNYGEADFAKKNPCWFYYDSEYGDVTVDNVIAWMPLPEPYKMDGKEKVDE